MSEIVIPSSLRAGDTVGIFTPSTPAYIFNEEKFVLGIKVLESLGFKVKLGKLTEKLIRDTGENGMARAKEFMSLYKDPEVKCLIATLGGMNSNSMIPYLDYDYINQNQKLSVVSVMLPHCT